MTNRKITMGPDKKIALVAHDNKKRDLIEWAKFNKKLLSHHRLYGTGTTGEILEKEVGLEVERLQSGPLGGDQQIGAKIAEGPPRMIQKDPAVVAAYLGEEVEDV